MIESAVSLVECPEASAWEHATLVAEVDQPFSQQVTMLAHERAVLAAWSATLAVGPMKTLGLQVVSHRQVASTNTAVHAARGNEFSTHGL